VLRLSATNISKNIYSKNWFAFARNHLSVKTILSRTALYELFFLFVVGLLIAGLFFSGFLLVQPLTQYTPFLTNDVQPLLEAGTTLSSQQELTLETFVETIYQTAGLLFILSCLGLLLYSGFYLAKTLFALRDQKVIFKKNNIFALLRTWVFFVGAITLTLVLTLILWTSDAPVILLVLLPFILGVSLKLISFIFLRTTFSPLKKALLTKKFTKKNLMKKGIRFFLYSAGIFMVSLLVLAILSLLLFTYVHPLVGWAFGLFAFFFWYVKKEILLRAIFKDYFMIGFD